MSEENRKSPWSIIDYGLCLLAFFAVVVAWRMNAAARAPSIALDSAHAASTETANFIGIDSSHRIIWKEKFYDSLIEFQAAGEQPKTDRDFEIHAEKSVKVEVVEQLANWLHRSGNGHVVVRVVPDFE